MGPNIVYSWLQALGIINDHLTTCDRYEPAIAFGNAHHDALMALKKNALTSNCHQNMTLK